jgi:restriction endonuclease S subunit
MADIPKIRFKGFTEPWEQRKLGDIITEYKETVDSDCTLPILTSSKTEGVILQEEHFGRKQQHDITGYNILPRNYCTYRNRSDGVDFTFNINKCCDKGIISKFYPVFSGKNSDVFFLSLVLNNSEEVVREIAYTCTGTGQKVLSFLDLQKMKVRVPNFDEQKEIAAYFESLDHLITLHQRKCDDTKELKKYMLQKMFPKNGEKFPEIRFKGFTEAWEQRKLGEVFEQTTNLVSPNEDEIELWSLTVEDGLTPKSERYNREFLVKKDNNFKEVRPGDIVYNPMNMTLGAVGYNGMAKSVAVSGYYTTMITKKGYDAYYINTWLKSPQAILLYKTYATGSLIEKQRVQFPTLSIIPAAFPNYDEQTKIGQYFESLDNLITLHQRKCDTLKELKKYMLQNMFPKKG